MKKNIYSNVKYVYEAPKNGQTVVICSTAAIWCAEPQHKSLLLAKVLSRLPTPMEAIWASRIRITYFRWCFSVKFMTVLVGGVVSLIVVFTMFAYVWLFCISLRFWSFCCFCTMASFLTGQKGGSVRWRFCPGGQLMHRFFKKQTRQNRHDYRLNYPQGRQDQKQHK